MQSFLALVASGNVQEGFDRYVHKDFIHHNQYFSGDRQSLLDAMSTAHHEHPNKTFVIKQILEEWDKVVTYSQVEKEMMDIVVMHMCRFDAHNMIVEMRDVGQIIDPESPNENGVF